MKTISLEKASDLRRQYVRSAKVWESEVAKLESLLAKDAKKFHANRKQSIKHAQEMVRRYSMKISELDECVCQHENAGKVGE